MLLSKAITEVLKSAGLDVSKHSAIIDASQFEIPDDAANALLSDFNSNVLTVESAKANGQLAAHFRALSLNPIDTELEKLLLDAPELAESIKDEKNTYQKINKAISAAKKKLSESVASGQSKADQKELKDELNRLNAELAASKSEIEVKIKEAKLEAEKPWKEKIAKRAFNSLFEGKAYPESFNRTASIFAHQQALTEKLNALGADLVFDYETEKYVAVQKSNPELPFYLNNQLLNIDSMIDEIGANNNLYKVSEPTPSANTPRSPQFTPTAAKSKNSYMARKAAEYLETK